MLVCELEKVKLWTWLPKPGNHTKFIASKDARSHAGDNSTRRPTYYYLESTMPVTSKEHHVSLMRELNARFYTLSSLMQPRQLSHPREGAGTKRWSNPDSMVATSGTHMDVSLAIADFKAVLAEIGKLRG